MCGIVGFVGRQPAVPILLDGLERLEYRGYDSAGITVFDGQRLCTCKEKGRLSVLREQLERESLTGTIGIGHTRWATHGAPASNNAHPHVSASNTVAIVHNGIIENYLKIREWLQKEGYEFRSETDTEVIVHLIDYYYHDCELRKAVERAVQRLRGSYAIAVISSRAPGELIAVRKDSPLVIGLGEGENFIASDIPALLKHTREVLFLEDGEMARVTADSVELFDPYGMPCERAPFHVDWDVDAAEKGGYPHFMLKEICEEPKVLADTLSARVGEDGHIDLSDTGLTPEIIEGISRIIIVACGTAYHAGLIGKYIFERLLGIPVEVDVASEYRYRSPVINPGDLFIAISQSGETADTLAALRLAKSRGARVLSLTNVVGSTHSREADAVMYTLAGPEIAVASTKAYTTQLMCVVMLAMELARRRNKMSEADYAALLADLRALPDCARRVIDNEMELRRKAHRYGASFDIYFFGRGVDYATALEGSLKLKEISYIHSEGFAAGELKHGPIALIEQGTPVIAVSTQGELCEKTASNIREVKARGAHVLAVCTEGMTAVREIADEIIELPGLSSLVMPILAILPLQLFAYYCALERGFDVDKPRNLAKSVTVE